jgi:excisionase family DNA binding protein
MNEQLVFFSLSKDELKEIIRDSIREEFNIKKEKELMTFKETCELLHISASCLNQWKAQGKIPFKKLGKRIYFSKKELMESLKDSNYSKLKELKY